MDDRDLSIAPWSRAGFRIVAVCLLFTAFGCASSGKLQFVDELPQPISRDSRVLVEVVSNVGDAMEHVESLRAEIENELFEAGLRPTKQEGSEEIKIHVVVTEFRAVSETKRFLLGAFAGQAKVVAEVTVANARSGEKIGRFSAEGLSSGGTIFAGTSEQAINEIARQIAIYMRRGSESLTRSGSGMAVVAWRIGKARFSSGPQGRL